MKKLSSKIIISLLLAVLLWGNGIQINPNKKDAGINISTVKSSLAAPFDVEPGVKYPPKKLPADWKARAANAADAPIKPSIETEEPPGFWKSLGLDVLVNILYALLSFANWAASAAGNIFDVAIKFSIIEISSDSYTGIHEAIKAIWVILRDTMNISFIFVLLWISIKMILGINGANGKKMIAGVIISALLINFSLFITRIVVDAGNMFAVSLYNQTTQDIEPLGGKPNGRRDISLALMQNTNMVSMYAVEERSTNDTSSGAITFLLVKIIMGFVFTWALLIASFLFCVRIIMFLILMALSPIGFMGDIIPYLKPHAKKWWDTLFDQTLVAPVFLFFMLLLIKISNTNSFAVVPTGASQINVSAYFNFIIIIALLIASVRIAKKLSGEAGATLSSIGAGAVGLGLGLVSGGTALLATKTIGAGAAGIMNSRLGEKLKNSDSLAARMTMKGLDKTSKATFDIRNSPVAGLVKKTGIDINRGTKIQKDGFQGAVDRNTKREEEYAKLVTKDMPDVNVRDERQNLDEALRENGRRAALALANPNSPENTLELNRLTAEEAEIREKQQLDDVKLKERIEKERKDARLEIHAAAASRGIINWAIGGGGARRSAAKAIRKLKGAKSAAERLREIARQQAEEDAAAANTPPAANPPQGQNPTPPAGNPTPPANPRP